MSHYEDMYKKLLVAHEASIKQYNKLQEKYDDTMVLFRRYSDRMESYIEILETENTKLREKLIEVGKLMEKYENESNKKGT